MNIAGIEVGAGHPCRIVAEIGANHNGDLAIARQLVEECIDAGADFIKFQSYLPQEMVKLRGDGPAPEPWAGRTLSELWRQAATPLKWIPELAKICTDAEVPWLSSVFGLGGLAFLEAVECPAYKLSAWDVDRRSLRKMVEETGKPVIRSCRETHPPGGKALKLYCPPGYPQAPVSLWPLRKFDGFSYHGKDPLVPVLAAAYGASMIEVHVELDATPSVLDSHSSLTVSNLNVLVALAGVAAEWRA